MFRGVFVHRRQSPQPKRETTSEMLCATTPYCGRRVVVAETVNDFRLALFIKVFIPVQGIRPRAKALERSEVPPHYTTNVICKIVTPILKQTGTGEERDERPPSPNPISAGVCPRTSIRGSVLVCAIAYTHRKSNKQAVKNCKYLMRNQLQSCVEELLPSRLT